MPPPPVWPELAGRTLGILGYGGIGQAVARRARAFDMRVCAIRRRQCLAGQIAGHGIQLWVDRPHSLDAGMHGIAR